MILHREFSGLLSEDFSLECSVLLPPSKDFRIRIENLTPNLDVTASYFVVPPDGQGPISDSLTVDGVGFKPKSFRNTSAEDDWLVQVSMLAVSLESGAGTWESDFRIRIDID